MKAPFSLKTSVLAGNFVEWTAALLLIIFLALPFNSCGTIESKKFNLNTWIEKPELRYQMVNDIIEIQLLIGMPKDKVIELLGSDAEEGPCSNCVGYSTNKPDQGFSIDHEVLEITFDKQHKVTSVRLNSW